MAPGGGLLVTLDGPSGVGKTTVSALVRDRLAVTGVPVVLTTTPSSSSLGELARYGTHEFFGAALACLVAAVFRVLRELADVVLVAAGTARA